MTYEMRDGSLPFARTMLPKIDALGTVFTKAMCDLARRRPWVFDRLGDHKSRCFFVNPTDLSFAFLVVPDGDRSLVRVVEKSEKSSATIFIDGPVLMLLGLLDAKVDGDALVSRRIITVEGPHDAMRALRLAVGQSDLRPADLLGINGGLKGLTNFAILGILRTARRLACRGPVQGQAN